MQRETLKSHLIYRSEQQFLGNIIINRNSFHSDEIPNEITDFSTRGAFIS